ncbi:phospholipase [Streptomyces sp. M2CJ-2]|uniref:phospholipase A2 n=1 Tax=Streptomyces sp. M2CJ-2 TaxID=2803948 RepID=UPI00192599C1|nr:phospholipase A2 [Streptomyces sp. M2CJ-2]MBL3670500.1 phospholipase [Streptomyces sp. M2CJ-2]
MRRTALSVAAVVSLSLLLPQQALAAETVDQPLAEGTIQDVGPGMYLSETQSFEVTETDVPSVLINRRHSVSVQADGVASPEDAPDTRADMGVFGPSWEAEFVGGQLNRKLEQRGDTILVTDLGVNETLQYNLKSSVDYPSGGGVKKYVTADGSQITETSRWNDAMGALETSIVEVIGVDLTTTVEGDDTFTDESGQQIPAADLKPTYEWEQAGSGADTWRVTDVGSNIYATAVEYDAQGRVAEITNPAFGDKLETSTTVTYADATTATSSSVGDYAGQVKEITVTEGATTQTLAQYAYDSSGLLRTVTDPTESSEPEATYDYDATDRLSDLTSPTNGSWHLDFSAGSALPSATSTGGDVPTPGAPVEGDAPSPDFTLTDPPAPAEFLDDEISGPQSYPSYCNTATSWMYYTKSGCTTKVAHYGWHSPSWKRLPNGTKVRGINHDHCTSAPDRPLGYDFRPACDQHDYGYGTIGNSYKGYYKYLSRNKGLNVDSVFWASLYTKTCSGYRFKSICRSTANVYYAAVAVVGRAKNGAKAT